MRLEGKTALIVGVGPGMGRAISLFFAQEGANVVMVARKAEIINATASQIRELTGRDSLAIQANATSKIDIAQAVAQATDKFQKIDILVALPGGGFRHMNDLPEIEEEFFRSVIDNHLISLFHMTRAAIPAIKAAGGGSILTMAAGYKVRRDGNIAYSVVKEGIIGFTKNLARELHPANIRVNALCPGLIRQPLPEGKIGLPQAGLTRKGQPEDIAHAALFLASDESCWITGQALVIDGGDEIFGGQPRAS
jgi:NAD(P)-dependent dehydrogenase (short-subunit alcohol dehydrogenase family)